MTRLEEAGRCLEPDVQPSIYKQLIELDDSKAIQSLTAWKWLDIIISIHFKQVGFGSFQVGFGVSVSYRWILLSMKFNSLRIKPRKRWCVSKNSDSPASRAKPPPPIFQVRVVPFSRVYTCLVPRLPHISFTTEKPHERGGISHWLDNRPHSAAVSLHVDDGNLACLMLLGVSVCKLDFTYYLNNY